jgi:hypothetical protein
MVCVGWGWGGAGWGRPTLETRGTPVPGCVQAWLQSLLSPGTPIPDRAKAHISLGSCQYQATWVQEQGSWAVLDARTSGGQDSAPAAPVDVDLSLLFVNHPVARLPLATSGTGSTVHRVSLLLQCQHPSSSSSSSSIVFIGSDASSAPPEQPGGSDDDAPVTVQCVARGCWGTCLPVAVAGVEEEEAQENAGPVQEIRDTSLTVSDWQEAALHCTPLLSIASVTLLPRRCAWHMLPPWVTAHSISSCRPGILG